MELTFLDELAKSFGVDGGDHGVLQRGDVDVGEHKRSAAPADGGGFLNWGSEMGRRATTGTESRPVVELLRRPRSS